MPHTEPAEPAEITLVIPGQRVGAEGYGGAIGTPRGAGGAGAAPAWAPAGLGGRVKVAVQVGARRAGGEVVRVTARVGEDAVVLHLAGGPPLVLHPLTARDLMLAQDERGGEQRARRGARDAAGAPIEPTEVPVPAELQWRGLEQAAPTRGGGFLGRVLLQAVEIVTDLLGDKPVAERAAEKIARHVDGGVDAGVYRLASAALEPLKGSADKVDAMPAPAAGKPVLVFLHGTFVDTASTFGKLWEHHPGRVRELFTHYADQVYALDHPTLGASPIDNALVLVRALPKGVPVRLHLVTHSRGGLVAEVLARVAATRTVTPAELSVFNDKGYASQRRQLQDLAAELAARDVAVERVVRVACPARGTLLASRRLDAYLSVLRWGLRLAGVPVAPALVDMLSAVARERLNPEVLPGLAAMLPDNPLVQWLNDADAPVPGDLRVVAGDLEGDSLGSWLKSLATDAFYWCDHDIVVQTRSMYGGAPRQRGASFLLDQGGKTTHFAYFVNPRTAAAVVDALVQEPLPAGFATIGPLSWAGESGSGVRGDYGATGDAQAAADKPAVFVLPGILGSNIKVRDKRIWLGLRLIGGLKRLAYAPGQADVCDDGPVGMVYDDLIEHLALTHEVIPFGFDWRRPIEEEARRLAAKVAAALDARAASGQPVRIVAHSMGGVLARTMALEAPDVWQRFIGRDGARLLMLGTPNGGSWAPMQVLSGDDTFGNALVAFGSPFGDHEARQLMAAFPGFIQLQAALLDSSLGLADAATWKRLAEEDLKRVREASWWHRNWAQRQEDTDDKQLCAYKWGVPPNEVLEQAVELRRRLDRQREQELPAWADRLLLVVGRARFTPDGYDWGDDGFAYLDAEEGGDGRVTHDSARLPGVRTWKLDAEHGSLPSQKKAFDAFVELLQSGRTDRLELLPTPGVRGGAGAAAGATGAFGERGFRPAAVPHVRSRPSRGRLAGERPASSVQAVFAAARERADDSGDSAAAPALRVTVLNGHLAFVRQPLLVGHYTSSQLTGTEWAVNRMVGGAMDESLAVGRYAQNLGDAQLFVNTASPRDGALVPRPEAVVVVGLGPEGALTEATLAGAVCQGVLAWAGRLAEGDRTSAASIEMAATLMGSGGIGFQPGNAARAIASGVREANRRIAKLNARLKSNLWPQVSHLVLVELYLERAAEAWGGLQVLATARPGDLVVTDAVTSGTGALRRQTGGAYRGAAYDFISATSVQVRAPGAVSGGSSEGAAAATDGAAIALPAAVLTAEGQAIQFRLDTRRARTEVRATQAQPRLLAEMVSKASNELATDAQIGRTLFQLLVPVEIEPFLGGRTHMLLEVDEGTAPLPWEILDTQPDGRGADEHVPWSVRSRLVRKLATSTYREVVRDAGVDDDVLVVGEPLCDRQRYGPLAGARAEAKAVNEVMTGPSGVGSGRTTALLGDADATTVINALMARPYRIVHIAGHGEAGHDGGVVLSGGTFLGPREIGQMRTVPELVFVNCCHLAARPDAPPLKAPDPFNRSAFAAGTADALIRLGVRCVVAAGWAVDDEPAKLFALTLYRALLARRSFIEAVGEARESTWRAFPRSNTWAAYQCYGDPDWRFRRVGEGAGAAAVVDVQAEYADIASPVGLAMALEKIAIDAQFGNTGVVPQERVRHLEARFGSRWGGMGAIAEAFGLAFAGVELLDDGIAWYERAVAANDGSASLCAAEQLANQRARRAWQRVKGLDRRDAGLAAAAAQARGEIAAALARLDALVALEPTVERQSLRGSAHKRLALVERKAGDAAAEARAVERMAAAYGEAEALARRQNHPELFYPALNRMAADLLRPGGAQAAGFAPDVVAAVRAALDARLAADADFWVVASRIELDLYEALARERLAASVDRLLPLFADLHNRVPAAGQWRSVADTAAFVLERGEGRGGAALRPAEAAAAAKVLALLREYAREAGK
ncbi:MAG: CHAT domain-containing protein [Rubrivivax sp.]|nr:CHAT domain-containing protein [Rubrivivax sp.]